MDLGDALGEATARGKHTTADLGKGTQASHRDKHDNSSRTCLSAVPCAADRRVAQMCGRAGFVNALGWIRLVVVAAGVAYAVDRLVMNAPSA